MKKIVLLASICAGLYASNEYVPFSEFSQNQKIKYNFEKVENIIKKEQVVKKPIIRNYKKATESNIIKKIEIRTEIKQKEEMVKEYKNENILKNEIKVNESSFGNNFSITPKLTYSYIKHDGYVSGKVGLVDYKNLLSPEVSIEYNNHILKLEGMRTNAYFKKVLIGGGDLSTKTSWYKLNYLYKYQNAKIGLAYNIYNTRWNGILNNQYFSAQEKQKFASLELHLKNEENKIQAEYGLSYGKNSEVDYAYEYYLNLGYKIFNDDRLIISAGYKDRSIETGSLKFEYKGPTISLTSTF
jgi:hypothetical protein